MRDWGKPKGPVVVGDDVEHVLADRRIRGPQRDAPQVLAEQHWVVDQQLERRGCVANDLAVGRRDVERAALSVFAPAGTVNPTEFTSTRSRRQSSSRPRRSRRR